MAAMQNKSGCSRLQTASLEEGLGLLKRTSRALMSCLCGAAPFRSLRADRLQRISEPNVFQEASNCKLVAMVTPVEHEDTVTRLECCTDSVNTEPEVYGQRPGNSDADLHEVVTTIGNQIQAVGDNNVLTSTTWQVDGEQCRPRQFLSSWCDTVCCCARER